MLCQNCKQKIATIHLTEISDSHRVETHFCEDCAQKHGVSVQAQIPINELLSTLLASKSPEDAKTISPSISCPYCGMTLEKFQKTSLLGCPNDYEVFKDILLPLIEKTHNGHTAHCGKTPSKTTPDAFKQTEMLKLRKQLDVAVKNEDYETAAQIRDKIRQLA